MYQIPELHKFSGLKHAFSVADEGNMANWILGVEKSRKRVLKSRRGFLSKVGVDIKNCVCMKVEHGSEVLKASRKYAGSSMVDYKKTFVCDGMIINEKNLYLFLLIADCLPIIFYDPKKEVIGLVHAGWRGAEDHIAAKALVKLNKTYTCEAKDLVVGFGPSARTPEYYKDFVGDCKDELIDGGVLGGNLYDCGINTMTDERFFSHRKDANMNRRDAGRFACVVGLE